MNISPGNLCNGLMVLLLLIPSICFGTESANRQILARWLSDTSGLSIDTQLAAVLADSLPEDIARDILRFPNPAYIHLSGRCITLTTSTFDSTSGPRSIQLCMFSSLAHSYMAGVTDDNGSYVIVSDTLVHAYHQPQFRRAPLGPDTGCAELLLIYGVPAPGRWGMTRYSLVEWCGRELNVVAEFSAIDVGTEDVDNDGQAELRSTDVAYGADPDTTFYRYYARHPVTRLFREIAHDSTFTAPKTDKY